MKERLFLAGMLAMALLMGCIGTADAMVGRKVMNADYQNITIKVDGDPIVPKDAQGKYVEPFAIEGTTYLPVRAVAETLGLKVEWDAETTTIRLTTLLDEEAEHRRYEKYCLWNTFQLVEQTADIADIPMIYVGTTGTSYEKIEELKEKVEKMKERKNEYKEQLEQVLLYREENSKDLVTLFEYWEQLFTLIDTEIYNFGMYCTANTSNSSEKYVALRDSYNAVIELISTIRTFERESLGNYLFSKN